MLKEASDYVFNRIIEELVSVILTNLSTVKIIKNLVMGGGEGVSGVFYMFSQPVHQEIADASLVMPGCI